uniref:Uncharacterized protein n=1 Tax=Echinococcus canadensis TaxID=519352 RepID=A0A915EW52_9CEST
MQTCISKRRSASQSVGALLEQGRISNKTRNELSGIECTNEKTTLKTAKKEGSFPIEEISRLI